MMIMDEAMYFEAVRRVIEQQRVSVELLQWKFIIGRHSAEQMIERMEKENIVGKSVNGERKVLVSEGDKERMNDDVLAPYRNDLELLQANEKYTYYYNTKTGEIAIYDGQDLVRMNLDKLANIVMG